MSELLRGAILVAATISMGLMAGLFYAFAISVMPGLGRTDDRTFVGAMQQINEAILNGWFAVVFAGSALLTLVAVLLHLGHPGLPWIVAALVLYGAALAITFTINVPLNNALAAAGELDRIADLAAVREHFEVRWVRWNVVRGVACTIAFGCLAWAAWSDRLAL